MEITKGKWEFYQKDHWCEVQIKEPLKSLCAININVEEHIENGKLMAVAPELLLALKVCYESLCTYGSHPIIEKQVENVLRKI
jgi:phosphoenolpyruvate carboxylase